MMLMGTLPEVSIVITHNSAPLEKKPKSITILPRQIDLIDLAAR